MDSLTPHHVRALSANDLGLPPVSAPVNESLAPEPVAAAPEEISADDPILRDVLNAIEMGYAGAILVGQPGTGKSWYAKRIASYIANGHAGAVRFVQFHPSYQYEDFMEGYTPSATGGFEPTSRILPQLCRAADENPEITHVLVIDEISRCDAARVFGEALTYIETDKRGMPFTLASGRTMHIPPNLVIIATMNPWDRGVDEVDIALERRFAHIDMQPDPEQLRHLLLEAGTDPGLAAKVLDFFNVLQKQPNEAIRLGHAYFLGCIDPIRAAGVWKYRLKPFLDRACRMDRATFDVLVNAWTETVDSFGAGDNLTEAQGAPIESEQQASAREAE